MSMINSSRFSTKTFTSKKFTFIVIAVIVIVTFLISMVYLRISIVKAISSTSCNCVVFRMDDAGDSEGVSSQLALMNLFMIKNQSFSLAVVMDSSGFIFPSNITDQLAAGVHKGLFELALHGFQHVHFPSKSEKQQERNLLLANHRMKLIFGNTTDIFVPPYSVFDNNTIKAMSNVGLKMLSANLTSENIFDGGKSIFIYNHGNQGNNNASKTNLTILHVPGMIYDIAPRVEKKIDSILADVDKNEEKYGYSVIVIHPFGFNVGTGEACIKGVPCPQTVDKNKINGLSNLIDALLRKGIKITSLREVAGLEK